MRVTEVRAASGRRTVEAAFDEYYDGLVTQLATMCGDRASAVRAAREAFRQAKAKSEFEEIGWPREWLLHMARNHLLRREFHTDSLVDDGLVPAQAASMNDFRRPSLDRVLSEARRARLKRLGALAVIGAAVIAVLAGALLIGWRWAATTPTAPTAATAARTATATDSQRTIAAAFHPTAAEIVGHGNAVVVLTMEGAGQSGSRLTVWKRCASNMFQAGPEHACLWGPYALAVEIRGKAGKTFLGLVPPTVSTITARADGTFTLEEPGRWRTWSEEGGEPFERAPFERAWGRGVTPE